MENDKPRHPTTSTVAVSRPAPPAPLTTALTPELVEFRRQHRRTRHAL